MTDVHATTIMRAPIDATASRATHPLVAAAMAQGTALADPATLRELLAVQREWEAGEAKKAYTRALAALKRDLPTVIAKDSTVDYQSSKGRTFYRHVSLAGVMDAITGPLTAHGFSLAWEPSTDRQAVRVVCRLTHAEGHSETCSLEAPSDTSGSKSPAQAVASTITLLSRYSALALLGIATADMPEDTGEERAKAPSSGVDTARNLRVAKALVDRGLSREAAEQHVGRPVSAWTASDLDEIGAWVKARTTKPTHDPAAGEVDPADEPKG